jgi:hypothetical protein
MQSDHCQSTEITMRRPVLKCLAMTSALIGIAAAYPASAQKTCEKADTEQGVVTGTLGLLEGLGPAAFIVTVPGGMCLTGTQKADNIELALTVQLYSSTSDGFKDLYKLAGEKVYVRGRLTGTRTFQQKAPILMEVIEIATR